MISQRQVPRFVVEAVRCDLQGAVDATYWPMPPPENILRCFRGSMSSGAAFSRCPTGPCSAGLNNVAVQLDPRDYTNSVTLGQVAIGNVRANEKLALPHQHARPQHQTVSNLSGPTAFSWEVVGSRQRLVGIGVD